MKKSYILILLTILISLIILPNINTQGEMNDKDTKIIFPEHNAEVNGMVIVKAEIRLCNDTSQFSLYVNNEFVTKGEIDEETGMFYRNNVSYYIWNYEWDTNQFSNGKYRVKVIGAHSNYDEIEVIVKKVILK